jgi:succinylglutamate desuccinylase
MHDTCNDRSECPLTLAEFDHFPEAFLDVPAGELWRHLNGPSLFHIPGRVSAPLFVSVLLHGNEHTGWQAVQAVLRRYRQLLLPRSMLLFVGNIAAGKHNVRTLPAQPDYNRIWPGAPDTTSAEARLMHEVFEIVRRRAPFASIDIHNNTGNNPHYACVNNLSESFLHLARLFSRIVVHFQRPLGVQSAALAQLCPAVTIECGRIGGLAGITHAAEFIEAAISLSHFPEHPVPQGDREIMQTVATVKVPPAGSMSFDGSDADFRFRPDLDRLNFSDLPAGTIFGSLGNSTTQRLDVVPAGVLSLDEPFFCYEQGKITMARSAIPAMLTVDPLAVELDCL